MKDKMYRDLSNNQLQAAFLEIEKNLKAFPGEGWETKKAMIEGIAAERDLMLGGYGTAASAIQGYLENAFQDLEDFDQMNKG
jgi:hypothetical protein